MTKGEKNRGLGKIKTKLRLHSEFIESPKLHKNVLIRPRFFYKCSMLIGKRPRGWRRTNYESPLLIAAPFGAAMFADKFSTAKSDAFVCADVNRFICSTK